MFTFIDLRYRLSCASINDRKYERPLCWSEAEDLLKQYQELQDKIIRLEKQVADASWKDDQARAEGSYDRGRDGWS